MAVGKAHLHAVASEVDAERRLRKLGRHLFRGELHFPRPVGVAIQAQILLVGIGLGIEVVYVWEQAAAASASGDKRGG